MMTWVQSTRGAVPLFMVHKSSLIFCDHLIFSDNDLEEWLLEGFHIQQNTLRWEILMMRTESMRFQIELIFQNVTSKFIPSIVKKCVLRLFKT